MGAGIYIGTAWETPDVKSTIDFASVFYKELFAGTTVGHAVLAARNFCAKEHGEEDLTWARYLLFGDPLLRLTEYFRFKKGKER